MKDIFILAAKRTPFGKFNGQLKDFSAVELGTIALTETIKASNLEPNDVDTLILGNVLAGNLGQNAARQVALHSGMPQTSTAMVVNQVCGSSLKAIRLAQGLMELDDAGIVAVGGIESMTNAPVFSEVAENGDRVDTRSLLRDGLIDPFSGEHMGITAENVANKYGVSRQQQDEFAFYSHQKSFAATENNWFAEEIIPIEKDGQLLNRDENIRPDTSLEKLAALRASFKEDGLVTAGNSAPLSDGASIILLATAAKVAELSLQPIAKLTGYAEIGTDPELMGYAPFYAINKLLLETKTKIADYGAFEVNEAFSSQAVAVTRDLAIPNSKLNVAGGALSIGHPLGATGSRLIATLINNLTQLGERKGIASLCIGGGMGIAYSIELVD